MPRRIDVELTSRRDDGTWTWRAAGAREPRGTVDAGLLPGDASLGMVLKAEVEIDLDGMVVTAVTPPKGPRSEPQRLQISGGQRDDEPLVTSTLVRRGRDDRGPRGDRGDRPDRAPGGRPGGPGGRPGGPGGRPGGPGARPAGRFERPGENRGPRDGARGARESGDRDRPSFERRPPVEARPKAKRLRALRTHRNELINQLPEEHRPIAEELFRGGVPAVRTALEKQNEQAKAESLPAIDPAPLLTLADRLWPQVRTAEWRDRAEGALADVEELDLRDLRSVVVAADSAARDDETRALATQLREALNRRVEEEHAKWLLELAELVAGGRVVAALRRSSRPPKAGAPLPAELAATLATQTSEALNAEVTADRWAVLLDALSFSPVRTSVTPISVPEARPEELVTAVRRSASRLPVIAALFGLAPEPAPPIGRTRRTRPAGRPIPPPGPGPSSGLPAPSAEASDSASFDTSAAADTADTAVDIVSDVVAEHGQTSDPTVELAAGGADTAGSEAEVADPALESSAAPAPTAEMPDGSAVADTPEVGEA